MLEPTVGADRNALRFFSLVFGTTWLFQLPLLLAQRGVIAGPGDRFMPLVVLGFFGPTIIALILSAADGGRRGLSALCKPLAKWRVGLGWYVVSLGLPGAIGLMARAMFAPAGELGPWLFPPNQAQHFAALLVVPFMEQIPWRGYVYPRLERTRGPVFASVVTGAAWALFHVQKHAFIDPNASLLLAALTIAYMTAGTVVFSWIYLRTGGSMLLVVIAHMGSYLNNPAQALPNTLPLAIHTAGFCLTAIALVFFDREAWRARAPAADPNALAAPLTPDPGR